MKNFTQNLEEMKELTKFLEEDIQNIKRVVDFCDKEGLDVEFEIHAKAETVDQSVKHSEIEKSQIIKSLVFIGEEPIVALCPGDKRVNEEKLENITGQDNLDLADPEQVEKHTGYIVGGVSPFDLDIPVYMEKSIMENNTVRPAAGSRLVGARLRPEKLSEVTDAQTGSFAD